MISLQHYIAESLTYRRLDARNDDLAIADFLFAEARKHGFEMPVGSISSATNGDIIIDIEFNYNGDQYELFITQSLSKPISRNDDSSDILAHIRSLYVNFSKNGLHVVAKQHQKKVFQVKQNMLRGVLSVKPEFFVLARIIDRLFDNYLES